MSIFHQHSHMQYMNWVTNYDTVVGRGPSLIRYTELISLPSHMAYEKSINLHLQKFIGKC